MGTRSNGEYFEGRTATAFEPEGRKWIMKFFRSWCAQRTIGAESRVNRSIARSGDGVSAVLAEIDRLESDHVQGYTMPSLRMKNKCSCQRLRMCHQPHQQHT